MSCTVLRSEYSSVQIFICYLSCTYVYALSLSNVCVCVFFNEIAVFPSVYYFKNNLLIQLKIPDIKFGLASFDA